MTYFNVGNKLETFLNKIIGGAMLEKEISELSDQSLLSLYKSIIPSTTLLESISGKLENHGGGLLSQIKINASNRNDNSFTTDKTVLNYKRHLIEMKILSLKILEEINRRDLETTEQYDLVNKEIEYIESCSDLFENSFTPNLASVPQGAETLPYLNRGAKK